MSACQTLYILFCGNFGLARNLRLTQTTPVTVEPIIRLYEILRGRSKLLLAFDLIMARFRDSTHGATRDALSADSVCKEKTVCVVIFVGSGRRRNLDTGRH